MKLSISNIAWDSSEDTIMYETIKDYGFSGIEIAPGRLVPINPYDNINIAKNKVKQIKDIYGLEISSMQSLLFGMDFKIFQSEENLKTIENLLMKAIDFASEINCKNLVFGSPKNRVTTCKEDYKKAIILFRKLGDYAFSKDTNFSLEANPKIYGTNFINTTEDAINFIKQVKSKGFKLNFDFGTVVVNNENLHLISENINLINHVHISEPFLEPILPRKEHRELYNILKTARYNKYVSIEMKNYNNLKKVKESMEYVLSIFT